MEVELPLEFAVSRMPLLLRAAPGPRTSQDSVRWAQLGDQVELSSMQLLGFSNIAAKESLQLTQLPLLTK